MANDILFGSTAIDDAKLGSIQVEKVYLGSAEVWNYQDPPGSIVYDTPGTYTFTVPRGYTEVTVCMVGGGGSGSTCDEGGCNSTGGAGGGYAGEEYSDTVSVTPGEEITVVVGAGGDGVRPNNDHFVYGKAGGDSSFGTITASGGARGGPSGYHGDYGAGPSGCGGGGYRDGDMYVDNSNNHDFDCWGGQASSFGNGGRAGSDTYDKDPQDGGVGAGGGGFTSSGSIPNYYTGNGGRGEVRISWGQ